MRVTTPPQGARPAPADRRIPLAGTFNLRDVGGYPAAGGTVRAGRLLRGDALHRLDDGARAALAGLPVRTVVDLREDFEVRLSPDALDGTGIAVLRLPVFRVTGDSFGKSPEDLTTVYEHMVDACGTVLAVAVGHVATEAAQPVLVHCSAGKDRTGMGAALILSVLGVPRETVVADYALTQVYSPPRDLMKMMGHSGAAPGISPEQAKAFMKMPPEVLAVMGGSDPAVMRRALAMLDEKYGGPVELTKARFGLTDAKIASLRQTYLI